MGLHRLLAKRLTEHQVNELIQRITATIIDRCGPQRIILFGSAARGEMTDASDIDLVVVTTDHQSLKAARKAFYENPRHFNWPVDITSSPSRNLIAVRQ
jgi:predicted nucleotidyltransferase/HEPN domain-containing protein